MDEDVGSIEAKVCAVCGRALDGHRVEPDGPVDYRHTAWDVEREGADDHPPVPVGPDEVPGRMRCDFCHADLTPQSPGYVLPVRAFGVADNADSNPDWLACEGCATLIESNRWTNLVRRAVTAWETRHEQSAPAGFDTEVARLYRTVRKNITGSLRPR